MEEPISQYKRAKHRRLPLYAILMSSSVIDPILAYRPPPASLRWRFRPSKRCRTFRKVKVVAETNPANTE